MSTILAKVDGPVAIPTAAVDAVDFASFDVARELPFALADSGLTDSRFADSLNRFQTKFNEQGPPASRFQANIVTRRAYAYASTTTCTLMHPVADVYHKVFGGLPRDATFSMAAMFNPTTEVERTEYGTMCIVFCSQPGMQILSKDGFWCDVSLEQSKSGVVISGALHPVLPSTKYRFTLSVSYYLMLAFEPSYATELTRRNYFKGLNSRFRM